MPADEAAPAAEASTDVFEERAARIRDLVKATMILRHTRASDLDLLRREKSGDQDTIARNCGASMPERASMRHPPPTW